MDDEVLAGFARRTRRRRDTNEPNGLVSQEEGETSRAVTVEDIVRAMLGIAQQHAPTNKFVEFKKLAPPYFDGSIDPLKAEKWIKDLEKLFDVLKCDDAEKVQFTIFQLQGNASDWWELKKQTYERDTSTLSCDTFKKDFYNTYFPKSLRPEKEMEFINLKQGNMTITEYQARFVDLAKFAQSWMGREITKVVDKTRLIERELGITRRIDEASSKKRSHQSANEGNRNSFRNRKPFFASSTTQVTRNVHSHNSSSSVQCSYCSGNHRMEDCRWLSRACVLCGQHGHLRANCTRFRKTFTQHNARETGNSMNRKPFPNKNQKMGQTSGGQARVFSTMNVEQARASNAVVSGTLYVSSAYALALFDSGATDSFISQTFIKKHNWNTKPRDVSISAEIPLGDKIIANLICKSREVHIGDKLLLVDLTVLDMHSFDIILGMDWLAHNFATVDCHEKRIIFQIPKQPIFSFMESKIVIPPKMICCLEAKRMIRKGCECYMVVLWGTEKNEKSLETVRS
ncbi:uncharacterized protein LOC124940453 [Impatiens glandulifera]|uniref:uncharacterized protein LOC124940453 n=1 Tax=Impatiens glandulifera TaxID=253017 RepID=UPI001FB0C3DC|nr:uncharacterized protein LOC124940453 [Impatiens glandulifera]